MEFSNRVKSLPPYVFVELSRKKKQAIKEGRKIIDLGIGDPDKPTPKKIINFIKEASEKSENHQYPIGRGSKIFIDAIIEWMKKRFNVTVQENEVLALIGAKDGITHLPLAFVNPGDIVLIPDPGYPGYTSGTILSGGETYFMPLLKENNFLPDLNSIPENIYKRTKIMWLNYPNNPTSAIADINFYKKAISYAKKYNFIIAQDAPYCDIYFQDPPVSILSIDGAKENVIEFFSLSKTYNMTGWRIGYAVGGSKIIDGLATVKENMDSGTVSAIQEASANTLKYCDEEVIKIRELYKKRAMQCYNGLLNLGFNVLEPKATLYIWAEVPNGLTSMEFATKVLEECDVVLTPGIGFGSSGDKYFRIALTVDEDIMQVALSRLKKIKK
jgi:LL-diaminopimelate aminotransferase